MDNAITEEQAVAHLGPVKTDAGYRCQGWEGPCERDDASVQRQRTLYADDRQNWVCLCPECMAANRAFWNREWSDACGG